MTEHIDDDYSDGDPAECPECGGSGTDRWNDHVLPCPMCGPQPADAARPSKEWYADKIADNQQAEDAAGGVLAAGALGVLGPDHQTFSTHTPMDKNKVG